MPLRSHNSSAICPGRDVAKHNTVTRLRDLGLVAVTLVDIAACAQATGSADPDAGTTPEPDARQQHGSPDARLTPDATAPIDAATTADAAPPADAQVSPDAMAAPDSAPGAYSHTIAIDGNNDFDAGADMFATTSAGYTAYVSWDATHIYLGYDGADIASTDNKKWLLVFFDTDPGMASGANQGEQYNTQRPSMPSGFGADFYYRWRASNDFQDLQQYTAGSWQPVTTTISTHRAGTFVEIAIERAALGSPTSVGITTLMVNEAANNEWSYAGLYSSNFTDGYYDVAATTVPLSNYLLADFSAASAPNAVANLRP